MSSLRDIKRRTTSVKNTQQITKAMKMVAASKLRRSQEAIIAARPYSNKMADVLSNLALHAQRSLHPLLEKRETINTTGLVVITSDRGLCGGFNTNILREARNFLDYHENRNIELMLVGRKGYDFFRRRDFRITNSHVNICSSLKFQHAKEIAHEIMDLYTSGVFDEVYMVYNEFKSVMSQEATLVKLLPIEPFGEPVEHAVEYTYEPDTESTISVLLPKHIEIQIYRALLESLASEYGARMTAMDTATNNAKDLIQRLTLIYNRARQASITKEILEISGGAEALKG